MMHRLPHRAFVINWLKALILSPGMLFPAAYLLVYLSTNIYLNTDFKKNLSVSVNQATGNTWKINIKNVKSGLVLNSVTLDNVELTPIAGRQKSGQRTNHAITIKTLEIAFPELQNILFSRKKQLLTTEIICKKILSDERLLQ